MRENEKSHFFGLKALAIRDGLTRVSLTAQFNRDLYYGKLFFEAVFLDDIFFAGISCAEKVAVDGSILVAEDCMRGTLFQFLSILVCLASQPVLAAKPDKSDHPLVAPYAGSTVYSKDVKQYDEYRVFKGWDKEAKQYNTEKLEGKVTKLLYKNPKERSVLEIYRNYEVALKKEGVEILYQCNQADKECVDGYVGAHLRQQFAIASIGNQSGRYVFAKLDQGDQIAYLVLAVGDNNTDVHVVEMKKMDTGMATLNMAALTEDLDKQGYVVVEGIFFDTDKTDLKPESKPALDEVAKLLNERADLKLYVVGHTDMQGSLAHNMSLSEGRAKSVVKALMAEYRIDGARLEGRGVGPLAPVATNASEGGRASNRRVVLVQR